MSAGDRDPLRGPSPSGWALFVLFVGLGLALRLADLGSRPLHGDEAVGAMVSSTTRDTFSFVYESANRHGPFQYWLGALFLAAGESAFWLRLPHALLGGLIPILFLMFRNRLGEPGWLVATGLSAISPAFVYYSRYAIQEIDFTLATAALLAAGAGYARDGRRRALLGIAASAAFLATVKETFVIVGGCLAVALLLGAALGGPAARKAVGRIGSRIRQQAGWAAGGFAGAAVVTAAFYSDGFRDLSGLRNLLVNLFGMLLHGASSADAVALHDHPASFYLAILGRYEWMTAGLALAGALFALRSGSLFWRVIALYALLLTAVHFALRYKTPWLLLAPLLPLLLLAGYGAGRLLETRWSGGRSAAAVGVVLMVSLLSLPATIRLCFLHPADPAESMIYHHAGEEQIQLASRIREAMARAGDDAHPRALVCLPYAWPLAWYLRDAPGVLFDPSPVPADPGALGELPVLVTLQSADPRFLAAFTGSAAPPPIEVPNHRSERVVLIPPDYMVGRLWIRSDLAPPEFGR